MVTEGPSQEGQLDGIHRSEECLPLGTDQQEGQEVFQSPLTLPEERVQKIITG